MDNLNKKYWFHKNPKKTLAITILVFLLLIEFICFTIEKVRPNQLNIGDLILDGVEPQYQRFDLHTFYNYKPNSIYAGWKFDKYGFVRTPNIENINNLKEKIVVLFGGSTVYGVGATDLKTTIPSYLQTILNQRNDGNFYRVYNAGVRGFFSYLEMIRYIQDVRSQLKPDIVIVLNGRNDIYLSIKGYLSDNFDTSYSIKLENDLQKNISEVQYRQLIKSIVLSTNTGVVMFRIFKRYKIWLNDTLNENIETNTFSIDNNQLTKSLNNYIFIMDIFKYLVEKDKKEFHWFIQPVAHYKKKLTDKEKKQIKKQDYLNEIENYDKKINFSYNYLLKENNNAKNLSEIFKTYQETLYQDDTHYNDKANKIIARELSHYILKN